MRGNSVAEGWKFSSDRKAAVSLTQEYIYDFSQGPRGVNVILLGAGGVATIGRYDGVPEFWQCWAPLPRTRKDHVCGVCGAVSALKCGCEAKK